MGSPGLDFFERGVGVTDLTTTLLTLYGAETAGVGEGAFGFP